MNKFTIMAAYTKFTIMAAAADPHTFFDAIKATAFQWANAGLDNFLVPVGTVCCGAIFIFLLIKCVTDYKEGHGEDMRAKAFQLFLCLVIAALLLTKHLWWAAFVS